MPGSTKWRFVLPNADTSTDAMAKWLKHISDEWNKIDQQLIDSAVKQWRKRLAACGSARGGHLEHML